MWCSVVYCGLVWCSVVYCGLLWFKTLYGILFDYYLFHRLSKRPCGLRMWFILYHANLYHRAKRLENFLLFRGWFLLHLANCGELFVSLKISRLGVRPCIAQHINRSHWDRCEMCGMGQAGRYHAVVSWVEGEFLPG